MLALDSFASLVIKRLYSEFGTRFGKLTGSPGKCCHTPGRPPAWVVPDSEVAGALSACGSGCNDAIYAESAVSGCLRLKSQLARQPVASLGAIHTRVLWALCGMAREPLRVLDLGGGAGLHYFVAKAALGEKASFQWNVVETEAMVRAASSLASGELCFFTDIAGATDGWVGPDVVFASGVMQCLPDAPDVLRTLSKLRPETLCLTRLAVSPDEKKYTVVQERLIRAPSIGAGRVEIVRYPLALLPRSSYNSILTDHFRTVLSIQEDPTVYRINGQNSPMIGYYCRDPQ